MHYCQVIIYSNIFFLVTEQSPLPITIKEDLHSHIIRRVIYCEAVLHLAYDNVRIRRDADVYPEMVGGYGIKEGRSDSSFAVKDKETDDARAKYFNMTQSSYYALQKSLIYSVLSCGLPCLRGPVFPTGRWEEMVRRQCLKPRKLFENGNKPPR